VASDQTTRTGLGPMTSRYLYVFASLLHLLRLPLPSPQSGGGTVEQRWWDRAVSYKRSQCFGEEARLHQLLETMPDLRGRTRSSAQAPQHTG